jgi:hypothetical protein
MPDVAIRSGQWKILAFECVRMMARTRTEFSADNIRWLVGLNDPPSTVGGLFAKASRDGIICKTGKRRRSNAGPRKGAYNCLWIGK